MYTDFQECVVHVWWLEKSLKYKKSNYRRKIANIKKDIITFIASIYKIRSSNDLVGATSENRSRSRLIFQGLLDQVSHKGIGNWALAAKKFMLSIITKKASKKRLLVRVGGCVTLSSSGRRDNAYPHQLGRCLSFQPGKKYVYKVIYYVLEY